MRDSLTGCLCGPRIGGKAALHSAAPWLTEAPENTAVILIDLRGFKSVNDTYGRTVGDATLVVIGRRLRETGGDRLVFRSGSDEFLVVGRFATEEDMRHFAAELRTAMEAPIGDVIVRVGMAGARASRAGATWNG